MKPVIVKLKNLYTNEIVYTENYDDYQERDGLEFINVFKEENPKRKYLVNRNAYQILNKE